MNRDDMSPIPDAKSDDGRSRPSLPGRLWKWINQRTALDEVLHHSLDEPIPGGARFAYVFGSALLFIFVSQIVTGICLALYYAPSPMTAHASVAYIVKEVAAGAFLRSLHSYGSSAMVVVLLLHFLQTFLYGSYKGKRELLWISGCTLSLLVLGMAFTGYLLSWDQRAYFAGSVGTDIVGQVPLIGERLRLLLRGGAVMGALTLTRFYVLHILIIPALIFSFIAIHIVLFRKAGAAGPANEDPVRPRLPAETFYPTQVLIDMAFVLLVMGVLGMLAHFVPVTLGPEANPTDGHYLPRPEWYFLPMFQWLKYWEGWRTVIGVVIIPAVLIGLLYLLPFMDRGLERRPWRRPIPVGGVFIVLIGLVWLGMTSRLDDSRDPTIAAQLAQQNQQEEVYFHAAFQPYSASSPSEGGASTSLDASAAQGKGIFDSHGCSGCHGHSGGGAVGPALTNISSQYPPTQLTELLKAPTAKMKAAGMVPLTLNAADMMALVSYVTSLGGTSAASAAASPASGASPPAPAKAEPGATTAPLKAPQTPTTPATAASSKAPGGSPGVDATATQGKGIFDSHGCSGCHGQSGGGAVGPALTHISSQYPPTQLTALLKAPTAKMKAAGMVPLTLNAADMMALVSYVTSLGGTSAASVATPPASAPSSPAPAKAEPGAPSKAPQTPATPATAASEPTQPPSQPKPEPGQAGRSGATANPSDQHGETIFNAQGCASCHGPGGVGTSNAPALTKFSKTITPVALTGVLQHPTEKMQAGGMLSVDLNETDMSALVAYLQNLGAATNSSAPVAGSPSPGASSSNVSPPASNQVAKIASQPPMSALESKGKLIFKAHGCADCHGVDGVGGTAAAPALAGTSKSSVPEVLTTVLQHPTARMQQGGMPPVSLGGEELKALVAYVSYISGAKSNPHWSAP